MAAVASMRMQVLANGDIVDCARLPVTARNNLYKTELCKHFCETGICRYGAKCQFAHGMEELRGVLRHPKYKTTKCKAFSTTGKCCYGARCRFIHESSPSLPSSPEIYLPTPHRLAPFRHISPNGTDSEFNKNDGRIASPFEKQIGSSFSSPTTMFSSSTFSSQNDTFFVDSPVSSSSYGFASMLQLPTDSNDTYSVSSTDDSYFSSQNDNGSCDGYDDLEGSPRGLSMFSRLSIFQQICKVTDEA